MAGFLIYYKGKVYWIEANKAENNFVGNTIKVRCFTLRPFVKLRKTRILIHVEATIRSAKMDVSSKVSRGPTSPKTHLQSVIHLCYAFGVSYATFKRWKSDAFVSKKKVAVNKGKSILTDQNWAQWMYCKSQKNVCVAFSGKLGAQAPIQKNDAKAKKVQLLILRCRSMLKCMLNVISLPRYVD
jgi:hypothetical protein